jgi:hypothetical protein
LNGPAPDPETPPKVIIIYNKSNSAPNISLNIHSQKRAEVRIAAIIGTFLQLGVLIYAGFATYYYTLKFPKEKDQPVSNYAFACTASGTILLVTGLLLCADVVEKRTAEEAWKPGTGYKAYPIWVQRQATVGDQVFRSLEFSPINLEKKLQRHAVIHLPEMLMKFHTSTGLLESFATYHCKLWRHSKWL